MSVMLDATRHGRVLKQISQNGDYVFKRRAA
jgi:hypothetical protein